MRQPARQTNAQLRELDGRLGCVGIPAGAGTGRSGAACPVDADRRARHGRRGSGHRGTRGPSVRRRPRPPARGYRVRVGRQRVHRTAPRRPGLPGPRPLGHHDRHAPGPPRRSSPPSAARRPDDQGRASGAAGGVTRLVSRRRAAVGASTARPGPAQKSRRRTRGHAYRNAGGAYGSDQQVAILVRRRPAGQERLQHPCPAVANRVGRREQAGAARPREHSRLRLGHEVPEGHRVGDDQDGTTGRGWNAGMREGGPPPPGERAARDRQ